jgi:hypothetical protein
MKPFFLALIVATILNASFPLRAQAKAVEKTPEIPQATKSVELKMETPQAQPAASSSPAASSGAKSTAAGNTTATNTAATSTEFPALPGTFSLEAATAHKLNAADLATVNRLKKSSKETMQQEANSAFAKHNFKLAQELSDTLCQRYPTNAEYFSAAGDACYYEGDYGGAFADFVTAWHLAGDNNPNSKYADAANSTLAKLRAQVDDTFRLTWGYDAQDQRTILNAATRLYKAGFTQDSVKMNLYALKNQPLYAQIAAYNIGAIAEEQGQYKEALTYYKWAGQKSRQLEQEAKSDPKLAAEISKSVAQLPDFYIEQAVSDTQKALTGHANRWQGWMQPSAYTSLPGHLCSDICPLCAISRTSQYYNGQSEFQP